MTDDLAKRFGWWWRDERILDAIGPQLRRVAFDYELASRAEKGKKPCYLLGKRFDKLTKAQMWEAYRYWPRRPQKIEAFRGLPYLEEPFELEKLSQALRQIRSRWSDDRRMLATVSPLTSREKTTIEKFERAYTQDTGWTLPQYFSFNLRNCGDITILKEVKKWLDKEREHLGMKTPKPNKGRANRSSKIGISFHAVEALDVIANLPADKRPSKKYDSGQARRAAREAKRLCRVGKSNLRMWVKHSFDE